MTHPFSLVDVFANAPFTGNPLAVITGAEGLDSAQMQRIAQWLNLSETTFLLPPEHKDADYKVRIFTLERELPFAGHPTLGTCHTWLAAGGKPKGRHIVQECGAGLINIKRDAQRLAFAAPPRIRSGPLETEKLDEICTLLNLDRADIVDHQWLANGPHWAGVLLKSTEALHAVKPRGDWPKVVDIAMIAPGKGEIDWELRAIFSTHTGALIEDPVTGSLNAAAAQWLLESGKATSPYVAAQGICIGRDGRIYVDQVADGTIWIGGQCMTLFEGQTRF